MKHRHIIKEVQLNSIAEEMELAPGDELLSINDTEIDDIFDYQFLCQDDYLLVLVKKADGEEWELEIEKDPDEDLGLIFEEGLMDSYHSCHNKCIFCFIDQMPKGMRETLYFKDDDTRLSFLQGNYVTLTNLKEKDVDRLIRYRLEPINISFQTMNPELRCEMLNNRFAGEVLKYVDKLFEEELTMNGQIVLCKDINDGEELKYSLDKLLEYHPVLQSLSVVPIGLTKYRDGLRKIEPFNKEDAGKVIDMIESYQKIAYERTGMHFVHASDEWYLTAERELPEAERYDGYLQIENGVGMLRSFMDEAYEELDLIQDSFKSRTVTVATGKLAAPCMRKVAEAVMKKFPTLKVNVVAIVNDFFGELITVSGLITATDLINQLEGKELGDALLLPENMLRSGEDVFLDDIRLPEVSKRLNIDIQITSSNGASYVRNLLGLEG